MTPETDNFLSLLSGRFTFQTFRDQKTSNRADLAELIHAGGIVPRLVDLHERGAGIYVTVNETDGRGRKLGNITRVRAVWQEDDHSAAATFPLAPSMVVETSPGHFHRYWLVADHWPADTQGRIDFANVMGRLVASYGSDNNAKDIARVLRVPGFLNRKSPTPHLVRLISADARRYTRAEITAAFPAPPASASAHQGSFQKRKEGKRAPPRGVREPVNFRIIKDALRDIPADDRDTWLKVGMALKNQYGEQGRAMWDDWSRTSEKFDAEDQDRVWASIQRGGVGIRTVIWLGQRIRAERRANSISL